MGASDWVVNHEIHKLADNGIQLRTPPDAVPANQYVLLTNVVPVVEGQLVTREGAQLLQATGVNAPVHTLYRLNQQVPSAVGDRIIGVGTQLFHLPLSNAGIFSELTGLSYSGNRLSIISFRYDDDQAAWAIIADGAGMMKYRGNVGGATSGYYQGLGIIAPTTPASASAGGAGVLDSTGGTSYDWLYSWLNRVTNSEGNPSPLTFTAPSTATKLPTASVNPDPGFGGTGFTNPNNAFDGNPATYANGNSASATEVRQSCQWGTWAASGGAPSDLAIQVDAQVLVTGHSGTVFAALYYSTDNGTTWKTMFTASTAQARQTYIAPIPAGIDFSQLKVRATVLASGETGDPTGGGRDLQNLIANQIRIRGGDFQNIGDLLDGGGGNRTIELRVFEINTTIVYVGSADNPLALVNQSANVCVTAPTATQDPWGQITHIRLYRRGGSLPDTWRQVGEYPISSLSVGGCGAGFLQINDNIADSGLGSIVNLDNDMPVTSVSQQNVALPVIWGPFDERVLGCGDSNRPESVYFSKRGNADNWPPENFVIVSDPGEAIIGGVVYNTRTFAFSTERMFELVPNLIGGVTFTPYPTPCSRGLVAPHAVCVGPAVYFVAKDGIYATTGGEQTSLTFDTIQPIFPTYDSPARPNFLTGFSGYDAVDLTVPEALSLEYCNGEVWFTYQGQLGQLQTLIYDIHRQRWRAAQYTPPMQLIYSERSVVAASILTNPPAITVGLLLGGTDGNVYQVGSGTQLGKQSDPGGPILCELITGSHDQGLPLNQKEYMSVMFDIDPGGGADVAHSVTITAYINGLASVLTGLDLTGTGRQQIPLTLTDGFGYNLAFSILWNADGTIAPILYQYDILWRREPASLTHWETQPTSHGLDGWQHVRDLYITIRSTELTLLTLEIDGVVQTHLYVIPSTNGKRQKVYIPLLAGKGKLYRYKIDAQNHDVQSQTPTFRIYEGDIEVRVRPWTPSLGYKVVRPFGGETITFDQYRLPVGGQE